MLFGIAIWIVATLWLSARRRRQSQAQRLVEEEARARGAQFDSNAPPKEAYLTVLGRATLNYEYRNFTDNANNLLFQGPRRFKDGGFLYYVQFWRRDEEVSGAVGLRWHEFHSETEVHEAHATFFEFVRTAITDQGYSFQSRWALDAPHKPGSAPTFGKRTTQRPPNLKGELPAHRRHFIIDGQPDWATFASISRLNGKGWRETERRRVSATEIRVAFESEGATSSQGYDLIVETTEETRERVGITLAVQSRNRLPSAKLDQQLAQLEERIRSNAAKVLAE